MEFLLARSAASNEATGRGVSFCSWMLFLDRRRVKASWFVPPLPLALGFLARSIGQRVAALALSGNRPSLAARARQRLLEGVAFALMLSGCATLPPHPPSAQDAAAPAAPNGPLHDYAERIGAAMASDGDGALASRSERSRAERPARAGGRSRRDPRCPVLSSGRTMRAARCSRSVCSTRPIAASRCDYCSTTSRSRRAARSWRGSTHIRRSRSASSTRGRRAALDVRRRGGISRAHEDAEPAYAQQGLHRRRALRDPRRPQHR